jgi:hypothetical protein
MLVTVADVLGRVRGAIHDETAGAYRWSDAKLVGYLADGAMELVNWRPDAATVREALQLTVSEALHDILPDDAIALLDVTRNMGADGATPGAAIIPAALEEMGRVDRSWLSSTPDTTILNWLQNPAEPTKFYGYPRAHATTQVWVEVLYSRVPLPMIYRSFATTDVDTGANTITIVGHGLEAGQTVVLPTPDSSLPSPLTARTVYYVLVTDGDTIQLAATLGGAAISLTDVGAGTNYIDSELTVLPRYRAPLQLYVAGSALIEDREEGEPDEGKRYLDLFYTSIGAAKTKAA